MISRVLPSMRMVARVSGLASVGHQSSSVSLPISFVCVSSDDQEIGKVRFGNLGIAFGALRILFGAYDAGAA